MKKLQNIRQKYASNILKASVLKNDTGLIIPSLNDFPALYQVYRR
jgi:inosine/xanthosine triphosphate pyrophosphatase family protein